MKTRMAKLQKISSQILMMKIHMEASRIEKIPCRCKYYGKLLI
jgi:hypothetical protein